MTDPKAHIIDDKQDNNEVSRERNGFESGWYLPGVLNPESKKLDQDPDEDAQALPANEFYKLLADLTSSQDEAPSENVPESTSA